MEKIHFIRCASLVCTVHFRVRRHETCAQGCMEGMGVGEFSVAHLNVSVVLVVSCPRGRGLTFNGFLAAKTVGAVGRDGAPRVTPVAVHGFRR